jgi:hypothetical protein
MPRRATHHVALVASSTTLPHCRLHLAVNPKARRANTLWRCDGCKLVPTCAPLFFSPTLRRAAIHHAISVRLHQASRVSGSHGAPTHHLIAGDPPSICPFWASLPECDNVCGLQYPPPVIMPSGQKTVKWTLHRESRHRCPASGSASLSDPHRRRLACA